MEEEDVKATPKEPTATPEVPEQKKPRYREALAKQYPDREFDTDEDAENALYEDYEQKSTALQEAQVSNQQVYAMIEANPALADVLVAMNEGIPFEVALAQCVDLEALVPSDGEPNYDEYQKAVGDRKKRASEIDARRQTIQANQERSKVDADAFFAEKGMDEEQQTAFVSFVDDFVGSLFRGEVSKTTLGKMYQAFKYEEAIADAAEQGEINGRNAKIETKRTTDAKTDGIPTPGGAVEEAPAKQKQKIFNI